MQKTRSRANTQDTARLQWSAACDTHKPQNYSKPTLYAALEVFYPSVIRVLYLHPSGYPGERIHPLPPRGPAGWHQSELRSIQNQSPGERSGSVTTSQPRSAIHQCVRRSSSLSIRRTWSEASPPLLPPRLFLNWTPRERAPVLRSSFLALSVSGDHASTKTAGLRKLNLSLWFSANKGLFRGVCAESCDY